jgi:hypothetical protein
MDAPPMRTAETGALSAGLRELQAATGRVAIRQQALLAELCEMRAFLKGHGILGRYAPPADVSEPGDNKLEARPS